jgi:hypothetical protein
MIDSVRVPAMPESDSPAFKVETISIRNTDKVDERPVGVRTWRKAYCRTVDQWVKTISQRMTCKINKETINTTHQIAHSAQTRTHKRT